MTKSPSDKARPAAIGLANPQETCNQQATSQTKQQQTTTVFLNPHHVRSDSFSSEALSVITEDEEMLMDGDTTSPLFNSNNKKASTSRSIISGRWVDTDDAAAQITTTTIEKVSIVDRTSHNQVMKLIDDTMLDLQMVPSEDFSMEDDASSTSSYCSAIQRVKQAVRQTKIMQRFRADDNDTDFGRIGVQSSRSSDIDKETLAELKLARDSAVTKVFDRHKVKGERYGRFVDVLRASLMLGGFLWTCCCCRGDWERVSREERILLAVRVLVAALLCYLSTVPLPLQHQTGSTAQSRLVHVLCSRKTMLLFTYLFVWAYCCDVLSRIWLPESNQRCSCSTSRMIQARRFRLSSSFFDSRREPSTISPKFTVEAGKRSERGIAALEKKCLEQDEQCEVSEEKAHDSPELQHGDAADDESGPSVDEQETLEETDHTHEENLVEEILEEQDPPQDNFERSPPKNPLSLPAFLRKAGSIDPILPSKSDAHISTDVTAQLDTSFGDFRKSALSSKLRDEKKTTGAAMQKRNGLLGRFSLVIKAMRLAVGPLLGLHPHDNEAIMDTIVEVWGSSS